MVTNYDGEQVEMCEAEYLVDLDHIEELLDWFEDNKDFIIRYVDFKKKFNGEIVRRDEDWEH